MYLKNSGGIDLKIIKRSQLALLSLSFMIMIAGYINYKYDPEREKDLGQTVHVSGADVFLYDNIGSNSNNVSIYTESNANTNNSKKYTESSLATFRSQRDNMFSELEETYKAAISSEQDTSTKEKYQEKLADVIKRKHVISIVENLIKSKGIKNLVIVPTGDNVNVIVESEEELTKTEIALIEKIIQDELGIDADKITITQSK